MRKSILLLFALALFTGCERYHVIYAAGSGMYVRDNQSGKTYFVNGDYVKEVPLP